MAEAEAEQEEGKKGGSKKKLIIMVVVFLLIGFVVAKKTVLKPPPLTPKQVEAKEATEKYELESKCAAANELPPPPAPKVEGAKKKTSPTTVHADEPVIGPVIEVDSKTLNLADGHFLKYGVAVQLPAGAAKKEIEETENSGVITSQAMLNTFANESMADILPTKQREALRHEVGNEVCKESEGMATTVYFTEFVAQ